MRENAETGAPSDAYRVPAREGNGKLTEKMSRFIGFCVKVADAEEAKEYIKGKQRNFRDARHVCWAYIIDPAGEEWQANDNGEPSGTAGRPILGQIRSAGLCHALVVVVRYFGGIKLGTPGLTAAYKESARIAIEDAGFVECHRLAELELSFNYPESGKVMSLIKGMELEVRGKEFADACRVTVGVRESMKKGVVETLSEYCRVTEKG